ncbi:MAG: cysteine synthase A [Eggerthellaceae bacterium]|nr:cysteine synthase A [Eggerthellaceae bacterium]MBR2680125.1 cysteine synthase A [Exiguobacterium sp.]MBR3320682.1 cysteine synthase A [Exiguobacterium sp.]
MSIHKSIAELIGQTPLLELVNYEREHSLEATLVAKVEMVNPAGSIKDRVALAMIQDAEERGLIDDQTVFIEPTSGNTGIGLAALAAARGNRMIITMPETMSVERRNLMKAYGAEVVLTDGSKGMTGAIEKADELARSIDNSIIPGQFTNPANPAAHEATTGPEIWEATNGTVDIFVAGVGTGGTLTGAGRYLKSKNPDIQVVAVEPQGSPVLSQGHAGSHGLQGIGAGFVPATLDTTVYDEVITIENEEAYEAGRELASKEGLLVGISSGAAVAAARKIAERSENAGKLIVVILPDSGERYLSTEMFNFL